MKILTVNDMYAALHNAVKDGLGDKRILLSDDDEGNGYHECFFGITNPYKGIFKYTMLPYNVTMEDAENNYVILG